MSFGNWEVNVSFDSMPQPVASAMSEVQTNLIGAEYDMIAYLGKQVANGTNYAVLAKQVLTTGRDTQNIVLLKFNQKPQSTEANLVGIEHILDEGAPFGGISVNPQVDIPTEIQKIWFAAFEGFVGSKLTPIAHLGSQVTRGVTQYFIAEATAVTADENPKKDVVLVAINTLTESCKIVSILDSYAENTLGYAFTW